MMDEFAEFLDVVQAHLVEWWSKQGHVTRFQLIVCAVMALMGSACLVAWFFAAAEMHAVFAAYAAIYYGIAISGFFLSRRLSQWCILMAFAFPATAHAQRTYWKVPLDTLAVGHNKHTHVAITGRVVYVSAEGDGDVHIRVVNPATGAFIIAECIPLLPCKKPVVGSTITVYGIARKDSEHGWWEVHPVERWQ